MELRTLPVGPLEANCYVLWSKKEAALLIDPGDEADRLAAALDREGIRPRLIVNTHGHFDHTGAVEPLKARYGAPYRVHRHEVEVLAQLPAGTRLWGLVVPPAPTPDGFLGHGDRLRLDGLDVEAIHTPGHTPGGTCFYERTRGWVFTGDTLFQGSIGRSDLPGGDGALLLRSIHERLLQLPPSTRVFPGHGAPTTIADEAEHNPFLV